MAKKTIIDKLVEKCSGLPKKQQALCIDIIENYREVHVLTIAELAKRNQVGTTTVIRLVQSVGYNSFQDFKKSLQEYALASSVDKWSYLKSAFSEEIQEDHVLPSSFKDLGHALNGTVSEENLLNITKAVQLLIEAKNIHVLGVRVSKVAALYFDLVLSSFSTKVRQLSYDNEFVFDRILQFDKGDIMVVFASSIMTKRMIEAMKLCHEQGHKIILITDLSPCPASSYADIVLQAMPSKNRFSIIPLLAISEALIIEVGRQTSGESIHHLEKIGTVLRDKNISI
ncbi:MAG: MurR/RpiR family transcriptional regulator [Bacillota bacterium]